VTQAELAEYIGQLAAELSVMTQGRGLPLLAYLLAITSLAAQETAAELHKRR
jgi:hypothetical protein